VLNVASVAENLPRVKNERAPEVDPLEAEVASLRRQLKRAHDDFRWLTNFTLGWEVRAMAAERRIDELADLFVALDLEDPAPRAHARRNRGSLASPRSGHAGGRL
jgi:hypothetical protein